MTQPPVHRAESFGLRDLLLYLIPGGIVLLGVLVTAGDFPHELGRYPGFAASLLGVLIAYFLGHAIYPINYRLWKWILPHKNCRKKDERECSEECEYFSRAYSRVADAHWEYHISEVSRFRSLARFASAMITPSILLAIAVIVRLWLDRGDSSLAVLIALTVAVSALGLLCVIGFVGRYKRYQLRFMNLVWRCEDCEPPWREAPLATASSTSARQRVGAPVGNIN